MLLLWQRSQSVVGAVAMDSAPEIRSGVEATVAHSILDEKKVVVMEKGWKSMVRMRVVTVGSCRVVDEALVHAALARTTARCLVNFAPWFIYVSRGTTDLGYQDGQIPPDAIPPVVEWTLQRNGRPTSQGNK